MKASEHCECHGNHSTAITQISTEMTESALLMQMSDFFKCFADPTRLKIINALLLSEMCVCDLTNIMNMTQPAVSHHLKHLRQMRLVKCRRDGKSAFYSLNDYHIQQLFDLCKTHLSETQN